MPFNRPSVHQYIYVFGLVLMLVGLGLSRFLISFGGMLIAANWLAQADFINKFHRLKTNGPALAVLGLFLLHLLWLFNTENFEYASHDLRIKLPLLLIPVVVGSSPALSQKIVIRLLWIFSLSVFIGTLMGLWNYLYVFDQHSDNIRSIVFFNSPIRFSLLILVVLLFITYEWRSSRISFWIFAPIALWLVGFMVLLQSITGLSILVLLVMIYAVYFGMRRIQNSTLRYVLPVLPVLIVFILVYAIMQGFNNYRAVNQTSDNINPLEEYSSGGERYLHFEDNNEVQSGNYIYRYIAPKEMDRSWNQRSEKKLTETDQRGQELHYTLLRYLSSLGLRKDSVGIAALSDQDIMQIEQGYTTADPANNPLVRRLRGSYYEVNAYLNGASAQGGSISQRLEYFSTGWRVTRQNMWTGVGTGDVHDEMQKQYEADNSSLDEHHRRRPHNQYLTFFMTFGWIGFLYFCGMNLYLIRKSWRQHNFMAIGVSILAAVSFLAEDTLETQVGVSLFALMLGIFLMQQKTNSAGEQFRFDELR